ncbi:MAG: hypothetical protein KKC37_14935 [Proteobacteria bacterium]|nr:hypothetical protein [Pseudomonadota bacterium]
MSPRFACNCAVCAGRGPDDPSPAEQRACDEAGEITTRISDILKEEGLSPDLPGPERALNDLRDMLIETKLGL